METILIDDIKVIDRQREDNGDVQELANSISTVGLIQPLVLDSNNRLLAGGRRLEALKLLKWERAPYVRFENLTDSQRELIEFEENLRRKNLTWQEETRALKRLHNMKLLESGGKWTKEKTAGLVGWSTGKVSNYIQLATELDNPESEIHKSKNYSDALVVLVKQKEAAVTASLSSRVAQSVPQFDTNILLGQEPKPHVGEVEQETLDPEVVTIDLTSTVLLGNVLELLPKFSPGTFSHIITDPPYGIDMDNLQQSSGLMDVERIKGEHTVEGNLKLLRDFIPLAYEALPETGFLMMWYDLDHHEKIMSWGKLVGFRVQRWPLIWEKLGSCKNEAANYNFTKNYEVCMVMRREKAVLNKPQPQSTNLIATIPSREKRHPFWKPDPAWTWLFNAVCLKGQIILDPFAGAGSMPEAAIRNDLRPVCFESNPVTYVDLLETMKTSYSRRIPKVRFI